MKEGAFAIAVFAAMVSVCRGQAGDDRVMPSRRCGDQFIVDAMINGQGPFALVVDTGCSTLVVDPRIAERLGGAAPIKGDALTPLGGKVGLASAVKVSSLRVGDVELKTSTAPVLGLDRIRWAYFARR